MSEITPDHIGRLIESVEDNLAGCEEFVSSRVLHGLQAAESCMEHFRSELAGCKGPSERLSCAATWAKAIDRHCKFAISDLRMIIRHQVKARWLLELIELEFVAEVDNADEESGS